MITFYFCIRTMNEDLNITENNPIAAEKLQKNVAEFIIYMYQMEDLIRVYQFIPEDIRKYVIHHFPVSDEEKEQMAIWFDRIMQKMKAQGIEESGHLAETQAYVDQLLRRKEKLLAEDEMFRQIYNQARPHIRESIQDSDGRVASDIQACLNGIYGLLLCRMTGKEVPEEVEKALGPFGEVLGYVSRAMIN